jgi:hypothetical protein
LLLALIFLSIDNIVMPLKAEAFIYAPQVKATWNCRLALIEGGHHVAGSATNSQEAIDKLAKINGSGIDVLVVDFSKGDPDSEVLADCSSTLGEVRKHYPDVSVVAIASADVIFPFAATIIDANMVTLKSLNEVVSHS